MQRHISATINLDSADGMHIWTIEINQRKDNLIDIVVKSPNGTIQCSTSERKAEFQKLSQLLAAG